MNILYHFTNAPALMGMIKGSKFQLSPVLASSDEEINKGHMFYLSMARTRMNKYSKDSHAVLLDLNWTKLKQKYKLSAVDYWNDPTYSEAEERLMSNKSTIPFWPYVTSVSINLERFKDVSDLRKVVIACKKHNIPCKIFPDVKSMYLNAKHKQVDLSNLDISFLKPRKQAYPAQRLQRDEMSAYLALFHSVGTTRFNRTITGNRKIEDICHSISDYMRYDELNAVENMLRSELNASMRAGGRRAQQAIALLQLFVQRVQTISQAVKQLGEAVVEFENR